MMREIKDIRRATALLCEVTPAAARAPMWCAWGPSVTSTDEQRASTVLGK